MPCGRVPSGKGAALPLRIMIRLRSPFPKAALLRLCFSHEGILETLSG